MDSVWNKVDRGLARVYHDHLRTQAGEAPGSHRVHRAVAEGLRLGVYVYFEGELSELEERGFQTVWRESERRVYGNIDLANLEDLAGHEGVERVFTGSQPVSMLDHSVPFIDADPGVWQHQALVFTGATGAGAVVAVLDTGIDFRHPFFMDGNTPPATRIRRIWDQGLTPQGGEKRPDPALLSGGPATYGVEYTDADINAPQPSLVRHGDYAGHGTHVASIAAGDGDGGPYIGVAPRADIVVVKLIATDPVDTTGASVPVSKRLRDAVSYALNVPATLSPSQATPPVAINLSQGSVLGPHDGFTEDEDWLAQKFAAGSAPQAFVVAAGNAAGAGQHARIEFAAASTVTVPFTLVDSRAKTTTAVGGKPTPTADPCYIEIYYPSGGPTLSLRITFPGGKTASAPALGGASVTGWGWPGAGGPYPGQSNYEIDHGTEAFTLYTGAKVSRNVVTLSLVSSPGGFQVGGYALALTASGKMTVHLWCDPSAPNPGAVAGLGIRFVSAPEVNVEDASTLGSLSGASGTVTVANFVAYDPQVPTPIGQIAANSSRGPLVSYGAPGNPPDKPDVSAPGWKVNGAKSGDHKSPLPGDTIVMTGTSMSAPHVTGLLALMLAKHPMPGSAAMTLLKQHIDTSSPTLTDKGATGAGRINAKNAVDAS